MSAKSTKKNKIAITVLSIILVLITLCSVYYVYQTGQEKKLSNAWYSVTNSSVSPGEYDSKWEFTLREDGSAKIHADEATWSLFMNTLTIKDGNGSLLFSGKIEELEDGLVTINGHEYYSKAFIEANA